MINFFKKLSHALKVGVEIAEEMYIKTESRDSFIVTFKGHSIRIFAELLVGNPDRIISVEKEERRKWFPPYEKEIVSDKEYQLIINAVAKHFENSGKKVKVERE